jgi:integrase
MKRGNGEGTVYYNEKRKRYEGKLVYADPLTRIKKRASFTSTESAKNVLGQMKLFKNKLDQGLLHVDDKMTLGQWLEYWLENYKKNTVRLKTYERYDLDIKKHIVPYLGNIPLQNLTTDLLQRHLIYLLDKGGEVKAGLSPRSVNSTRRLLIQSLEDAVDLGYLLKNCARRTKPMRTQRVNFMVLSHEMAARLIEVAKEYNYPSWIVIVLALGTGMRLAEIFGLSWNCIDLENKKLVVVQSAVKTKHGTVLQQDLKTTNSRREIPLPRFVVEALKEYKAWQEMTIPNMKKYNDQGFVVTNNRGNIMHPATFSYHVFKQILLVRAGISNKLRFHDLRHTHATWLLEAGVNVKVVSERLGHANIRITLDTYAHVLKTMQGEAVTALDNIYLLNR